MTACGLDFMLKYGLPTGIDHWLAQSTWTYSCGMLPLLHIQFWMLGYIDHLCKTCEWLTTK